MKRVLILLVILNFIIVLNAQITFDKPNYNFNPNFQLGGIINPNQIKMNHSLSFMSGASSSGQGFYQSTYTNHLKFDLRDNLKFNVDLSFVNLGSMSHDNDWKFSSNNDNHNVVVPAFSLEYKPSDNTKIYFEYRQIRGYQHNNYNRYHDTWWR